MQHGATISSAMTSTLQIYRRNHEGLRYETNGLENPLIENVVKWFPELKPLLHFDHVDDVGKPSSHPFLEYSKSMKNLIHNCGCWDCRDALQRATPFKQGGEPRVCLVALTVTILVLCHCLVQTVLDSALYPTMKGLREVYFCISITRPERTQYLEGTAPAQLIQKRLCRSDITDHYSSFEIYFVLFTRYSPLVNQNSRRRPRGRNLAASRHGICVYSEILIALTDQYSQSSRIHVTAGVIESSGKTYDNVLGGELHGPDLCHMIPNTLITPDTINTVEQWMSEFNGGASCGKHRRPQSMLQTI